MELGWRESVAQTQFRVAELTSGAREGGRECEGVRRREEGVTSLLSPPAAVV